MEDLGNDLTILETIPARALEGRNSMRALA
jgi:hypothetical protein